jgi:hypothetical protein
MGDALGSVGCPLYILRHLEGGAPDTFLARRIGLRQAGDQRQGKGHGTE